MSSRQLHFASDAGLVMQCKSIQLAGSEIGDSSTGPEGSVSVLNSAFLFMLLTQCMDQDVNFRVLDFCLQRIQ